MLATGSTPDLTSRRHMLTARARVYVLPWPHPCVGLGLHDRAATGGTESLKLLWELDCRLGEAVRHCIFDVLDAD